MNYIQKDMIRMGSTRLNPKNPNTEDIPKYDKKSRILKEDKDTKSRKTAIIYGILFGLSSVENMIYDSLHVKRTNVNRYNSNVNAFDIERMSINVQNMKYNSKEESIELPEVDIKKEIENAKIDEELEVPEKQDNNELQIPEIPNELNGEMEGENVA